MENQEVAKTQPKCIKTLKQNWPRMGMIERIEKLVLLFVNILLAVIIFIALIRLTENVYQLLNLKMSGSMEYKAFQVTFGMLLTLLITFEFYKFIVSMLEGRGLLTQVKIVVLIAIIAKARMFLVLDPKEYEPSMFVAYAIAVLCLGLVYWLLSYKEMKDAA